MTTKPLPQSILPSVAFDIPVEKKENKDSSPIQKRLENTTHSKKSFSIQDILKKLTDARKRRENVASANKAKTSAHNAGVKNIVESFAKRNADSELETRITSKLNDANSRREFITAGMTAKLSKSNKDKEQRGNKALTEAKQMAKDLEEMMRLKEETAEARREQLLATKVKNLSILNDSKIKRGQLALELNAIEARHNENQLNQKLMSATHRREMVGLFKSINNNDVDVNKRERVADVKFREKELARTREIAIEDKIKSAEMRRTRANTEATKKLSEQTRDKLLRGAESIQDQTKRSKENQFKTEKKLEEANERRTKQVKDQLVASSSASARKEARKEKITALIEAELKVKEKTIHAKILDANMRKEEMLLERASKIEERHNKRKEHAVQVKQIELQEAKHLGKAVEKKLKNASARKEKITMDARKEVNEKNKNKVEKLLKLLNKNELKEMQQYIDIENKIALANAKRQEKLSELTTKSNSKKHIASLKPSPTRDEIDARMNKATARREMFLLSKVDKASASSSSKKLSPRCDLFTQVTPRDELIQSSSPRIKAIRLENQAYNKSFHDDDNLNQPFSMIPIITTSVIAIALVGMLSFWKH